MASYDITAPMTPGAQHTIDPDGPFPTLRDARRVACDDYGHRGDLTHQDVRIFNGDDLVEYAGPSR